MLVPPTEKPAVTTAPPWALVDLAEGKFVDAGSLEIPGAKVGDIIQGLVNGSQGIIEKLNEDSSTKNEQKSAGKSKSKKTKK